MVISKTIKERVVLFFQHQIYHQRDRLTHFRNEEVFLADI